MGRYEVIVSAEFRKEFYNLPKNLQSQVRKILKKLEFMPNGLPSIKR